VFVLGFLLLLLAFLTGATVGFLATRVKKGYSDLVGAGLFFSLLFIQEQVISNFIFICAFGVLLGSASFILVRRWKKQLNEQG